MPPRKKKTRRERAIAKTSPLDSAETRAVEATTIAWMLCVLTTLTCQIGGWITLWLVQRDPAATGLALLTWILLFAAIAVGLLSLLLAAVVLRTRRDPPPTVITVCAVLIGLMPVVAILWN